ncbi:MAG: N-acetylmuramic acid 6-phosphate etherase [Anaerolineales bacterium]|jgi:N-acetylmuramic acid 6-phosphate etherase|nr:N-acetylmuramic acid 6-phosphate etherase [Anaerolineales bacterium]
MQTLTEQANPFTRNIDIAPTLEMVRLINQEDARVAAAVAIELEHIARAIDAISERMKRGGRLIYIGAGTSGRLGVLDASECPPTFSTAPELVVALLAGGKRAITEAVEGAEDDSQTGAKEIAALDVSEKDSVVGVAASGGTPYVLGGIAEARRRGALTVSVACNRPSKLEDAVDIGIAPLVGPEVIAGSTRLKAGTAQKLVLNMLSTGAMIKLGKTFGNLMVDVQPTNVKLRDRARNIVAQACGVSSERAGQILEACAGEVKTAIVAELANLPPETARQRLRLAGGLVRQALALEAEPLS